ncbi:MAG: Fe-S cluster assembly protein SufD [Xanthomonadales bacterium]|nr:Fe-S cluster assembly protein SufD [Xanthomonadales bacterium]
MADPLLDSLLAPGPAPTRAAPAWLDAARRQAREALVREGLPGARNEAWKYTSLRALAQRRYMPGDAQAATRNLERGLADLPGLGDARLVFANGVFRADLSRLPEAAGLVVEPLADALADADGLARASFERRFDDPAQVFARLNTALADDGFVLRVAPGARVAEPVHVVVLGAGAQALAWNLRLVVELGAGSALTLVEHHAGEADDAQLGNVVAEFALGAGARLDLLQLQVAAESATRIRRSAFTLAADAVLNLRTLELGGALARHDLVVGLDGDRARLTSRGVFVVRARQHSDTRLDVRHRARDTACDLVWRGVASGRARGVLHGAITVDPGADGTDASLDTKNLLLSAQAEIDVQPVLEIHADEVKAAHGATVGQLDERALFYLRTRGLPEAEARALLTLAFCRVAVDTLENVALREHVDALLLERLPVHGEPA